LLWELQWGSKLKFLMQVQETTGSPPTALLNRPKLTLWIAPYYEAYSTLNGSRQIGMNGAGPIPLSEIDAYTRLYGITDQDEKEKYVTMINALDSAYLKFYAAKQKTERRTHGK